MNFYDSEHLIQNHDISYRLFIRIVYFYFLLSIIIIHSILYSFIEEEFNYTGNFTFIYSYNINLMIFINCGYLFLVFFYFVNFTNLINNTIIQLIYYLFNLTEFILKTICTIINSFVILEPEFQFFTFYIWNLFLILNIYSSFTIYKYNKRKITIPGKKNKTNELCPICFDNNTDWILPCNHIYHYRCFKEWYYINKSCPYCRRNFNT